MNHCKRISSHLSLCLFLITILPSCTPRFWHYDVVSTEFRPAEKSIGLYEYESVDLIIRLSASTYFHSDFYLFLEILNISEQNLFFRPGQMVLKCENRLIDVRNIRYNNKAISLDSTVTIHSGKSARINVDMVDERLSPCSDSLSIRFGSISNTENGESLMLNEVNLVMNEKK